MADFLDQSAFGKIRAALRRCRAYPSHIRACADEMYKIAAAQLIKITIAFGQRQREPSDHVLLRDVAGLVGDGEKHLRSRIVHIVDYICALIMHVRYLSLQRRHLYLQFRILRDYTEIVLLESRTFSIKLDRHFMELQHKGHDIPILDRVVYLSDKIEDVLDFSHIDFIDKPSEVHNG